MALQAVDLFIIADLMRNGIQPPHVYVGGGKQPVRRGGMCRIRENTSSILDCSCMEALLMVSNMEEIYKSRLKEIHDLRKMIDTGDAELAAIAAEYEGVRPGDPMVKEWFERSNPVFCKVSNFEEHLQELERRLVMD